MIMPVLWYASECERALKAFSTDRERGLSSEEAAVRLARYGPNALMQRRGALWYAVLGRQFKGPLVLILFVAAGISLLIGEYVDTAVIMAIVSINGALGFVQEWKAEQAIDALQRVLTPHARVRRDGYDRIIDATNLVPGDIVFLETGDRVPADLRLIEAINLAVDESVLTGESVPVYKTHLPVSADAPLAARTSMAWMGTTVTSGVAHGLVVDTGMLTEFGRIAGLTEAVKEEPTHLQRKLSVLGKQLGFIAVGISILMVLLGILTGKAFLETFMTGVSLAVAVVPEGLPAVVTITLALGIRAMVRRNVLLRRLPAAETIGAVTVICTDKTGTLTQNEMTVDQIWLASGAITLTGIGYEPIGHFEKDGKEVDGRLEKDLRQLLETGLRCNHAEVHQDDTGWHAVGDPTEAALVVAAYKAGLEQEPVKFAHEISFTAERKRMAVIHDDGDGLIVHAKGAPEVILSRCAAIQVDGEAKPMTEAWRREIESAFKDMARSGRRTLAVARRRLPAKTSVHHEDIERDLTLLGFASIVDPPREEAADAVAAARTAGIRVIMITGDAPETAKVIGSRVGLEMERILTGAELESMSDEELDAALGAHVHFARTAPQHKLRIIGLLQGRGEIVGMTGDGVNDAPALKKADIGIAMGKRGSDVAQSASDMVLTDDNFASIVNGVEEGRRLYENIKKFVRYLLSSNTGEVLAIFFNIMTGAPLLLLPIQILWMNLVTDGASAVALSLEPVEKNAMRRPPHDPGSHILGRHSSLYIAALGIYMGLGTLFLFHYFYNREGEGSLLLAQTVAFTGLVVMEKVNVFNFRSMRDPLHTIGFFSNPWLLVAVAATIGLQLSAVYLPVLQVALHTVPLGVEAWIMIVIVAAPAFIFMECIKLFRWSKRRRATLPDQQNHAKQER